MGSHDDPRGGTSSAGTPTTPLHTCVFCESPITGGGRGEDIIPNWYARKLNFPNVYVTTGIGDRVELAVDIETTQSQTPAARQFRLDEICRDCNNGWMSEIEQRASLILKPMIQGPPVCITPEQQLDLADWAILKAVTWAAKVHGERSMVTTQAAALFSGHRPSRCASSPDGSAELKSNGYCPEMRCFVVLGSVDQNPSEAAIAIEDDLIADHCQILGYQLEAIFTIALGRVVLQCYFPISEHKMLWEFTRQAIESIVPTPHYLLWERQVTFTSTDCVEWTGDTDNSIGAWLNLETAIDGSVPEDQ